MTGFNSISKKSVGISSPSSGFGEVSVVNVTPVGQGTFVRGFNDILFVSASNSATATVAVVSGSLKIQSGNDADGFSRVRLKRGVRYRAGQGSLTRLTAIFGPPLSGTLQTVGAGNVESGYYFGYQGTNFGVMRHNGGIREVRTLTVATGVASTTNVTIELNGTSSVHSVAGGSNIFQTAHEISNKDFTKQGGGWYAQSVGGAVVFIALMPGARTGSYSASGTGLTATFARTAAGVAQVIDFVSQSAWNIDKMDGKGASGFALDTSKGNVYQVGYQYLGYGNALFSVENSKTGKIEPCHNFINANARTTPVLRDPASHAVWQVENVGSTISTHMTGASAATFVEGMLNNNIGIILATTGSKASVTAEVPLFTVRNDRFVMGQANYGDVQINTVTMGCVIGGSATRSGVVRLYKNATLSGPVNFQKADSQRSIVSIDRDATGFSLNSKTEFIYAVPVTNGSTVFIDLQEEGIKANGGESITVTVSATDAAAFDVTMNWYEDQ